jgi:hypothetical protein
VTAPHPRAAASRRRLTLSVLLLLLIAPAPAVAQAFFPTDLPNGDYAGYWSWPGMVEQLEAWQSSHPDRVRIHAIGRTYEGREILAVRVTNQVGVDDDDKPEVLFMAGIHPREQPPQVSLMRFMEELIEGYGTDERVTRLVDTRSIWFIPMYNVDGKVFDFVNGNGTRGANWRTTRRPFGERFGVDLNRNGVVGWGSASDVPGSQTFHGTGPISEPESQVLFDFMASRRFRIFLDIHSALEQYILPAFLIEEEATRFHWLTEGMKLRQRAPYGGNVRRPGAEPAPDAGTGAGQTHVTGFYIHGAYSYVFEVGPTGQPSRFYPTAEQILDHYERNVREPWYFLLEEAARLPWRGEGSAALRTARVTGTAAPGARVEWLPEIDGEVAYAVLVSRDPAVRVTGEVRMYPYRSPHVIHVSPGAEPGTEVPLQLYLWDRDRRRTVIDVPLRIEAAH